MTAATTRTVRTTVRTTVRAAVDHRRARRRDRRVYRASHPVLLAVLSALRFGLGGRRPVRRLGPVVVVTGTDAVRHVLTRVPLDRSAEGTTGRAASDALGDGDLLFDQDGAAHRGTRRSLADRLDQRGVDGLRCTWEPLLRDASGRLRDGGDVDVVRLVADVSGATAVALTGRDVDGAALADAARAVAARAVGDHLPRPPWRRRGGLAGAGDPVTRLLGDDADGLAHMVTLATVNTTVAGFPRAVAWVADAGLWDDAADPARRAVLATELLRVTAASPVLPRAAAADADVAGCPVRAGDRLLLVARDAALAPWCDPSVDDPAPASVSQLVFGAGPHACPGAGLARAQLADLLAALAPLRPEVVEAVADRDAALPSWRRLVVRATVQS
ncbi:cytochrome P450 family protein [Thalassiella azotivora]